MDSKFTQFVVFATSIIILILLSLFSNQLYNIANIAKPKITNYPDNDYIDLEKTQDINQGQIPTGTNGQANGQTPSGEMPTGTNGQMPSGQMPSGTNGQMPSGTNGQMPTGQMPSGQMPTGTNGQMPTGTNGQMPSGQMPTGTNGQMPTGQINDQGQTMFNVPSFLKPLSSRDDKKNDYNYNTDFDKNDPATSLSTSDLNQLSLAPVIPNLIPQSRNLGTVKVLYPVAIGDSIVTLDYTPLSITAGMQLVIEDKKYTITDVNKVNNWRDNSIKITLNSPSLRYVAKGTYLQILSPVSDSTVSSNSNTNSNYSSVLTPSKKLFDVSAPKIYILHLSRATNTNGKLMFKESVNITNDSLKHIADNLVTTNEPFDIIEGLNPTITPTMTTTMTPTPDDKRVKIVILNTETDSPSTNKSMFYVSDSLGYPIKFALFKNNTLILELDTNDDTLLYSGYYRLVL